MHTPHRGRQLRSRAAARKVRFASLKIKGLGSLGPLADFVLNGGWKFMQLGV